MDQIRVLVVDDSAFMRHALTRLLGETPSIEVVGSACNGEQGLEMAAALSPDVITLDIEMPVLDGLGMLTRLMAEKPTRVVMLSSITTEGAQITLDSLDLGAIDFVSKPSGSLSIDIGRVGTELVAKIHAAASMSEARFLRHRQIAALNAAARASRLRAAAARPSAAAQRTGAGPDTIGRASGASSRVPIMADSTFVPPVFRGRRPPLSLPWMPRPSRPPRPDTGIAPRIAARRLVVVASSTGGPGALNTLIRGLPDQLGAAMVIVQHMPPGFTASLADRLDAIAAMPVHEAAADDVLATDEILIAPGDRHLICSSSGHVQLVSLPPVNGVRPAADVTLQAVVPLYRERLLCVVLTGMGCDGREGARAAKLHGGTVFAQDEATSTIYGMPAAVAEAGLTDRILPLPEMAAAIARWCAGEVADGSSPEPAHAYESAVQSAVQSVASDAALAHAPLERADT